MKSLHELPINIDREKIAQFCRERGIRKLSLFGSVVRDDFDPERSDVDVLVEFLPGKTPGYGFVHCRDALESMMGRRVDLVTGFGKNIRPSAERDLATVYEQA